MYRLVHKSYRYFTAAGNFFPLGGARNFCRSIILFLALFFQKLLEKESLNHVFGITGIMKIIGDRMKYVSTNFSQKTKLKFQIEIASSIDKIK